MPASPYGNTYRFLLPAILLLPVLSGCGGEEQRNANARTVVVLPLDISPNADIRTFLDRDTSSFTGTAGPFINLTLLRTSGWFLVRVTFPGNRTSCYLDTGPVPAGIRTLAVKNDRGSGGWDVLTGDQIPIRFLGPIEGGGGQQRMLYLRVDSPLPLKAMLTCPSGTEIDTLRAGESLFRAVYLTLTSLFIVHFLFFYFVTRDPLHLHFAGFFLSYIGYFLFFSGTIKVLPFKLPEYAVLFVSVSFALVFWNQIFLRLFHLRQRSRAIHLVLTTMTGVFLVQLLLFPFSQRGLIFAYFISSEVNTIILMAVSLFVLFRGRAVERVIGAIFLVIQFLSFHAGWYFSGFFDFFFPALGASPVLFNYMHFSGMIVLLGLFGGLFLGSLSARFSSVYNQMQIVEDDGKEVPRAVMRSREDRAADEGEPSFFNEEEANDWNERLHHLLMVEKIYQDPGMDLNGLAERMGVQPWRLSLFLNGHLRQSFWEIITSHRVEEVARRLREDPGVTILRIAFEAGFDSKSTFNRVFRKFKGVTPSDYRQAAADFDE